MKKERGVRLYHAPYLLLSMPCFSVIREVDSEIAISVLGDDVSELA
jgi:hypothetical protein